jgi:hypothetical protein
MMGVVLAGVLTGCVATEDLSQPRDINSVSTLEQVDTFHTGEGFGQKKANSALLKDSNFLTDRQTWSVTRRDAIATALESVGVPALPETIMSVKAEPEFVRGHRVWIIEYFKSRREIWVFRINGDTGKIITRNKK